MADLPAVTTPVRATVRDRFTWHVEDGWQQGRGAWGGLVIAALARAGLAAEPDPHRRLRSVSAQILGPVPAGEVVMETTPLRIGSGMSTRSVRLWQATDEPVEVLANGVVVLGAPRSPAASLDTSAPGWRSPARPKVPGYDQVPVLSLPVGLAPTFTQHVEMRPVAGVPTSGSEEILCWVRLLDPPGDAPMDDVTAVALVDALWPAMLSLSPAWRTVATVTFEAALVSDPSSLDPAEPLLHRGRVVAARDGYVVETRELWSPAGELVVTNVQTMALIR